MKIYGISASPRHLTTEYALNKALDLLNDEGFETKRKRRKQTGYKGDTKG